MIYFTASFLLFLLPLGDRWEVRSAILSYLTSPLQPVVV